jgi:SAM-dependent methyltransferase
MGIDLHQEFIHKNSEHWNRKPLLKILYNDFYRLIAEHLSNLPASQPVELGSGLGNIKEVIPSCLRTDLFPNPWIDQVENAYKLSFDDESISDLILTDVFHHLKHPGKALEEFYRVLRKGGRVIMLEPYISLLGLIVYGAIHREPIGLSRKIEWWAPGGWAAEDIDYYAAQGNATRIFGGNTFRSELKAWQAIKTIRLSALAYAASGGYSGPQLYPRSILLLVKASEKILDLFPFLFATRMLIILEK